MCWGIIFFVVNFLFLVQGSEMAPGGSSPCASCKVLRRRCTKDCIFVPYFPHDEPHKFALVHKVFGASNVRKMLQELPIDQREDAVSSLVYEATARIRDPVYGCVGAITYLQDQVSQLQMQLAVAQAENLSIHMHHQDPSTLTIPNIDLDHDKSTAALPLSNDVSHLNNHCNGLGYGTGSPSNHLNNLSNCNGLGYGSPSSHLNNFSNCNGLGYNNMY